MGFWFLRWGFCFVHRRKKQKTKSQNGFSEIFLVFLTGIVASSRVQHRVSLRLDHGEPFSVRRS